MPLSTEFIEILAFNIKLSEKSVGNDNYTIEL